MKARWIIAVSVLMAGSFSSGKTRMLVEDPNNPVVGRYSITAEQARQAADSAESFLANGRAEEVQKAYAIRFIEVDAGPLTQDQQKKEPTFLAEAQARFTRYGVSFDPNQTLHPVVVYDTICHRIIHSRLYTVTELPAIYDEGRVDEEVILYVGGGVPSSKSGYYK
jgi:hypothetical protein